MTNKLNREQLRQDIRDANYAARRTVPSIAVWILGVIVFAGLIGVGIWAVKVATSGAKGAGDQTRQVNSGTNRIGAQEQFESLFNQIKAYDQQLDQAAADKKGNPGVAERNGPGSAQCSCGAESPELANPSQRRKWHRDHKNDVRSEMGLARMDALAVEEGAR